MFSTSTFWPSASVRCRATSRRDDVLAAAGGRRARRSGSRRLRRPGLGRRPGKSRAGRRGGAQRQRRERRCISDPFQPPAAQAERRAGIARRLVGDVDHIGRARPDRGIGAVRHLHRADAAAPSSMRYWSGSTWPVARISPWKPKCSRSARAWVKARPSFDFGSSTATSDSRGSRSAISSGCVVGSSARPSGALRPSQAPRPAAAPGSGSPARPAAGRRRRLVDPVVGDQAAILKQRHRPPP